MGYVKLKKAAADFDILTDANVAMVKLVSGSGDAKLGKIEVTYVGDITNEVTITPSDWLVGTVATHFVQGDVTKINEALLNAKGIPGNPVPALSQVVGEVNYAVK